jgi:hypothetical protein
VTSNYHYRQKPFTTDCQGILILEENSHFNNAPQRLNANFFQHIFLYKKIPSVKKRRRENQTKNLINKKFSIKKLN